MNLIDVLSFCALLGIRERAWLPPPAGGPLREGTLPRHVGAHDEGGIYPLFRCARHSGSLAGRQQGSACRWRGLDLLRCRECSSSSAWAGMACFVASRRINGPGSTSSRSSRQSTRQSTRTSTASSCLRTQVRLALGPPLGNRTQNARVGADELSHQPIRGSGAHGGTPGWEQTSCPTSP